MNWTNRDMLAFARVASEGAYGKYDKCNTLEKKLAKFKELKEVTMSRYTKKLESGRSVSYGSDHILGYFFDVFDVPDKEGEEYPIIEESTNLTKMKRSKMIYLMDIHSLPESHIEQVAMDLPII